MLGPSAFRNATSYVEFELWVKRPLTPLENIHQKFAHVNLDSNHVNRQTFYYLPCPRLDRYVERFAFDILDEGRGFNYPYVMWFYDNKVRLCAERARQYDAFVRYPKLAITQRIFTRFYRETRDMFEKIVLDMPNQAKRRVALAMGCHARLGASSPISEIDAGIIAIVARYL